MTREQEVPVLIQGLDNVCLRTDDSHFDRIHSSVNADYCFIVGYSGKQPLA